MATVPTATTGHDNIPGDRMTVRALLNECKRRPAVEVRATHKSTEWEAGTLTAYGAAGDMGGVAFTVAVIRGGVEHVLTVAEDRVRFPLAPAVPTATSGWCDNPAHGGHDHWRNDRCTNFVSDAEWTARLMAEAREHDRHVTYSPEVAYVEQHRPY